MLLRPLEPEAWYKDISAEPVESSNGGFTLRPFFLLLLLVWARKDSRRDGF
jgi:hypothetical protein